MARALQPRAQFEYVLEEDRHLDDDNPTRTVWILRRLSVTEEAETQDAAAAVEADGDAVSIRAGTLRLSTFRLGFVGVRKYLDADGNEVRPTYVKDGKRQLPHDSFIERIRPEHLRELTDAIQSGSKPSEDDAGKSSPPST